MTGVCVLCETKISAHFFLIRMLHKLCMDVTYIMSCSSGNLGLENEVKTEVSESAVP